MEINDEIKREKLYKSSPEDTTIYVQDFNKCYLMLTKTDLKEQWYYNLVDLKNGRLYFEDDHVLSYIVRKLQEDGFVEVKNASIKIDGIIYK